MKSDKSVQAPSCESDRASLPPAMATKPVQAWVGEAAKQISAIGKLGSDWDSHNGLPLSETGKRAAFVVLDYIKHLDLPTPNVVLGSSGSVHLEWRSGGKALELDPGDGQVVDFVKVDAQGRIEEGQVKDLIQIRLCNLAEWLLN